MKYFLIPLVAVLFLGSISHNDNSANGLTCEISNMTNYFATTDVVFLGKALSKDYYPNPRYEDRYDAATLFSVIEPFKGIHQKMVNVTSSEWFWGANFTENNEYVVFATYDEGKLGHQLCTPTHLASESDLEQIRKASHSYIPSPISQIEFGIDPDEVQCKEGLVLIQKSSDGSPACVKTETKSELIERGWAKYNSHNAIYDKSDFDRIQIENRGMENQTCFGIYSNETRVSIACDMVTHGGSPVPFKPETKIQCQGNRMCLTEVVTRVVDGDTIHITGGHKIRLSLTNTPEVYEAGFYKATQFTENLCPVGSKVIVDQDDVQPYDAYDRLLGKVICDGKILNAELLYNGHANILTQYCKTSEFSKEKWAEEFGC